MTSHILNAQTINRQCDRSRDEFVPSGGLDYIKMNQIASRMSQLSKL